MTYEGLFSLLGRRFFEADRYMKVYKLSFEPLCVNVPAFSAELQPFTTVTKTSTLTFMAFSLKFGDKRSFFNAVKNHTMGCYQTFVTTYFKMH